MTEPLPTFAVGSRVAILAALSEHLALRGYPPTVDELVAATGITYNQVYRHLLAMREAGYVTWEEGRSRTLRFAS